MRANRRFARGFPLPKAISMLGDVSQTSNLANPRVRRILAAAKALFLERSYSVTSTDDIARKARVSKGTLYAHFEGKEALFSLVIREELQRLSEALRLDECVSDKIEMSLRNVARQFLTVFLSRDAIDLYRVVVNEAPRFPQFGRQYYEEGPRRMVDRLADLLRDADRDGRLVVPDAEIAAVQFVSLVRANLILKSALRVEEPTVERRSAIEEAAVDLFLRGHRVPPGAQHNGQRGM
jgi:AcrR family transcriptional regulator